MEPPDPDDMPARRGRAARTNPPNRFERLHLVEDPAALEEEELRQVPTSFFVDASRSILAQNDSPDIPFTYSLNPYRGCEHGCSYCYARPGHEYLGYSAGLDFETKIVVKREAPALLAQALGRPSWEPEVVVLSGSTDPYQPAERRLRLTRGCLEVFERFRNPVSIITKNHLVTRDVDLLAALAERQLVQVTVSITSLRADLIGTMEPRTSRPERRLQAIAALAEAGVPVGVNVAPVIPGLTDEEMPAILEAAAAHGASYAGYIVLRLPGAVKPLFLDWLERTYPDRYPRVVNRLREIRGEALTDSRFGARMKGEGVWAELFGRLFESTCRRYGLQRKTTNLSTDHFRRVRPGQTELF